MLGLKKASWPKNCNGSGTNNYLEKKIKTSLALPFKIGQSVQSRTSLLICLHSFADPMRLNIFKDF